MTCRIRAPAAVQTMMIGLLIFVLICTSAVAERPQYITRHNVGCVMHYVGPINIQAAISHLNFIIELPDASVSFQYGNMPLNCTSYRHRVERMQCTRSSRLVHSLHSIHRDVATHIQRKVRELFESVDSFDDVRAKRSILPFVGKLSSFLFGTVNEDQLKALQTELHGMKSLIGRSASTFASASSKFANAVKLQNDRIDSLNRLIVQQGDSMQNLANRFSTAIQTVQSDFALMTIGFDKITDHLMKLGETESLRSSIELLLTGTLSQHLIPRRAMLQALNSLQQSLTEQGTNLTIMYTDTHHYYSTHKDYAVGRQNNTLVVSVQVPLASTAVGRSLDLYEVIKTPMPVPGSKGHYMRLVSDTEFIGFSNNSDYFLSFPSKPVGAVWHLSDVRVNLQSRTQQSCDTAMLDGNLEFIRQFCQYRVIVENLPHMMVRVSHTHVLVTGMKSLYVQCDPDVEHEFNVSQSQVIIRVPCQCTLSTEKIFLPKHVGSCSQHLFDVDSDSILHTTNLVWLAEFFDATTELSEMLVDSMHNDSFEIQIPALKIKDRKYNEVLALDHQRGLDVSKAIQSIRNDSTLYQSYAEYVVESMLEEQGNGSPEFHLLSWYSWLQVFGVVISVIGLIGVITLSQKVKTLNAALMLTRVGRAGAAQPLVYRVAPTTPAQSDSSLHQESVGTNFTFVGFLADASQYISVEILLIIIVLLFLASVVIMSVHYRRRWHEQTYAACTRIFLELGNHTDSVILHWQSLPHVSSMYTVTIRPPLANIAVEKRYGLHVCRLFSHALSFRHKLYKTAIEVNHLKFVPNWTAKRISAISNSDYYIALIMISGSDMNNVVMIRPFFAGRIDESRM